MWQLFQKAVLFSLLDSAKSPSLRPVSNYHYNSFETKTWQVITLICLPDLFNTVLTLVPQNNVNGVNLIKQSNRPQNYWILGKYLQWLPWPESSYPLVWILSKKFKWLKTLLGFAFKVVHMFTLFTSNFSPNFLPDVSPSNNKKRLPRNFFQKSKK